MMDATYFPLLGMNYILNDTTQIVDLKMDGVNKVNILLCAQPNSYPHFGTLINFIFGFAYADILRKKYRVEVEVTLDLLEHAKGEKVVHEESVYFKPLNHTYSKDSKLSDYEFYRVFFEELLSELSELSGVDYKIRTFNEFQKERHARRALIDMYNNHDRIAKIITPKENKLRTRLACPQCGLYSTNTKDTKITVYKDKLEFSTECPEHGFCELTFDETNEVEVNPNVPMRNLMKGISIIENDAKNNTLSIVFEGADWGGVWPLRVYYEGLKEMGYNQIQTLIYTPQILDRSGSKLSKRKYVGGDSAYRCMYDEYIVNISLIKDELGDDAIKKLWNIFSPWASDPKYFFRDYTVNYLLEVMKEEF